MTTLALLFPIIAPVLLIALFGWGYARWRPIDMSATNRLNVELLSPLLVFSAMTQKHASFTDYGPLLLAVLVVTLGSGAVAWLVARQLGYARSAFSAPQMFTNTGNIGLPLWLFAFGEAHFPAAIAVFVLLNLLHFTLGIKLFNRQAPLLSVLQTPMIWALVAGLAVQASGYLLPEWLAKAIKMLGEVAIPLMLFALGVRMAQFKVTRWRAGLLGGLLCPVVGLLLAWPLSQLLPAGQAGILLLYGALPPAVLNYLFAEQYQQDPELVAALVVAGTLLSLIFIPLGLWLGLPH
ncbi:AEC family transporter [Chitinibacter tainanensis]|uniref:AEC family transporter n=1 Tax=Chitinibacter tainanensis TaxID=230667 RepID=UPI00041BDF1E|nr:AEC family transporter [Chitinibacter tainanensis]